LEDKIGEGQFGDVHKGVLHPNVSSYYTTLLHLSIYASVDAILKFSLTVLRYLFVFILFPLLDKLAIFNSATILGNGYMHAS